MKPLSQPVRQALALTILMVLLLGMWALVIGPVLALASDRRDDNAALSDQLVRLQATVARRDGLARRAHAASGQLAARQVFWAGPSHTAIAARMQDLVRAAAVAGGGQVVSFSDSGVSVEGGFSKLSERFRVEGPLDAVQRVLAAVEAAHPALFVENLAIMPTDSATSTAHPPQLGVEVGIVGYLQGPS